MIPSVDEMLTEDFEVTIEPSKTYRMNTDGKYINGLCGDAEAVRQSVYKILNTERYKYIIYSWDYGIEIQDLIGLSVSYVCSELQRRITEALLQDDRIEAVTDFEFDTSKKKEVVCAFIVHTIFGDMVAEKVVNI